MTNPNFVKDLVSVIIPTINYSSFLQEAIESVFQDGYDKIELIIVFDGEMPLAPPAWLVNPRLQIFATGKRSGAAAAINLGIQHARGEYIARLDADDISLPGRFRAQIHCFDTSPEMAMVGTKAMLIDDSGGVLGEFFVHPYEDLRRRLLRTNPFVHSSVMFRHASLLKVGGYNDRCIRMQDYELILRIAQIGEVAILPNAYVHYRVHAEQSSKKLHGFAKLMKLISFQRRSLAKSLGSPALSQVGHDCLFAIAQLLRYSGLRRPRYLLGAVGRNDAGRKI